ncbi:MAG: DNA-3-methyladenine glycosylase [Verrucomicrobia bacterium]|nr:DNA-3-methyladenine glycosylase [Verrucomicrobiota bacterium]
MGTVERSFFRTDPLRCARALIGCELVWGPTAGIIVETEAYLEFGDEACHTFLREGARRFLRERPAGFLYVYPNYGVHWLLNLLVRDGVTNGFVLVRALQPTAGLELMRERRRTGKIEALCSGPGKLTQALAINGAFHGKDLFTLPQVTLRRPRTPPEVETDRRVGITRSAELEWRFLEKGSRFVTPGKARPRTP